jgi:ATP-dependent Clp protease protease subunit
MKLSEPDVPPEIPYPFPPLREPPRRTAPVAVPLVAMPSTDPRERLFERRTVLVAGRLDGQAVTQLCAELMALDGRAGDAVELVVNSGGGPLREIAAVLDVLDLMRARVHGTCVGMATGTAAALLACATGERRAGRNARITLRVEAAEQPPTSAAEAQRLAAEHTAQQTALAGALSRATGQTVAVLLEELERGGVRSAEEARSFGIVDRVT